MRMKTVTMLLLLPLLLAACGSTSTPDLKLIMILHCGENNDACSVESDNTCEGKGSWDQLRDHNEIVVNDNSDKLIKRHDLEMGAFDEGAGTCTFSETIAIKSTSRYRIYIDDRGPFDITKPTLEGQNWTMVLEFNT